jgi:hypothetical protein
MTTTKKAKKTATAKEPKTPQEPAIAAPGPAAPQPFMQAFQQLPQDQQRPVIVMGMVVMGIAALLSMAMKELKDTPEPQLPTSIH